MLGRSIWRNKRYWLSGLLLAALAVFYACLPEPLFKEPVSSILLDRNNRLLGAHIASDEQWRFPPLKRVPPKFASSIIAFEDKRYWHHLGVDPLAIARAIRLNFRRGKVVSGASTLSMQVIRLASHNPERTLLNKILEAMRALRLETRYSKGQILALYASYAPFGGNVVGLEAAAWRYFGRSPEQLSWAESAMLAVLPNSPGLIHPGRKRERLKLRRDHLLKKLYQNKTISKLEYQLAIAEPLPQKPRLLPRLAPHLLATLASGKLRASGVSQSKEKNQGHIEYKLYSRQKRFVTTLDALLQQQINEIARYHGESLALKDIHNLAILVIDNHSFEVKAYVGNTPVSIHQAQHGQAIDLIQRPRSTGSTLKPFLFASMIEHGEILPETLVADAPVRYSGYRPKNYDRRFRGAVRAKKALASSLNIPAVNMLSAYGVERFLSTLRQMGMTTLKRRSREYGLPLILGGAEGTLWELTGLYANLANRAQQGAPDQHKFYRQAVVLKDANTETRRIDPISPPSAWMTLQALLEVTRPGAEGYWKRFSSSHKIAWKTGTSFGHRDAWAIGATPQYTVGVWVGNAAGEGRQGMTGVKVAAPILFDVFNRLDLDGGWFRKPLEQMKRVSICKDDGYLVNGHCAAMDYLIPKTSHFDQVSPYHRLAHLDASGEKQVHGGCESISHMRHQSWFVLPPDQAFYYQQSNPDYKPLPPWRVDCEGRLVSQTDSASMDKPMSLIYPRANTQIVIPVELSGKRGKTLFKAIHRKPDARVFWHLDSRYLGETRTFHEQMIYASAGEHKLTLVDEAGNTVEQGFKVLAQ